MLTVDVESDWGTERTHGIESALPRLLDLLERYDARATFFVVGDVAEAAHPHLAEAERHEIGSHGMTHSVLTRLSDQRVRSEVAESRQKLEELGFEVSGFRAPFLRSTKTLPETLRRCGYAYDSSLGSVYPSLRNLARGTAPLVESGISRLRPSTLRDRVTPFSLTYLRLFHPLGLRLRAPDANMFFCHLHEFLDERHGWCELPRPLRRLHARNTGQRAWTILEELLRIYRNRTVTCHEFLGRQADDKP